MTRRPTPSCTREEAEQMTDQIRRDIGEVRRLIAEARDGRAWHAMGYESWEECLENEPGLRDAVEMFG